MGEVVSKQVVQEEFDVLLRDVQMYIDASEKGRIDAALDGMNKADNTVAFAEAKERFKVETSRKYAHDFSKRMILRARDAILDKAYAVK